MRDSLRLLLFAFSLSVLLACDGDILYKEQLSLPSKGWGYDHPIRFTYTVDDTAQVLNMVLDVHHVKDYRWQNLYVKLFTSFPGGRRDTQLLSLELADRKGHWLGKSKLKSSNIITPILLQESFKFQIPGTYTLDIQQDMRVNPVKGIRKLELRLEKVHITERK